ncbi:threonine synthase [Candidatus Lokiarchaeum ossiferum]|uniref:threonine synthase n=1 Tax=Candidatus Lokiarchaeum ossiferum TaxID=2951803 RepID=UPI00352E1A60
MIMMQFYSTNKTVPQQNFEEILFMGQAPDFGLYMPESIPKISKEILNKFNKMSYAEIATEICNLYLHEEIAKEDLLKISKDAYDFEVPLVKLELNHYIMRLDQGPTSAFKDFAARMMSRLMQHFLKKKSQKLTILVATSGDTGGAIADAYLGLDNIEVIILYPATEVSARQRKQMTTLGKNITAIALNGKFDDCQKLVKQAFGDADLTHLNLSSANSINFGRILPQIVYYFYAACKISPQEPCIISVPSGNFGNLMGGLIAKKMGLPVEKFVVAVNENDEYPQFLKNSKYQKVEPSKACLSSAMNVGHPSNLVRLVDLYGGHLDYQGELHALPNMDDIKNDMWSISVSDDQTIQTIKKTYDSLNYILEPHGAVAWYGLNEYLKEFPSKLPCISIETADPAKFPEEIEKILGIEIGMTENMKKQSNNQEYIQKMDNDYNSFKKMLLTR